MHNFLELCDRLNKIIINIVSKNYRITFISIWWPYEIKYNVFLCVFLHIFVILVITFQVSIPRQTSNKISIPRGLQYACGAFSIQMILDTFYQMQLSIPHGQSFQLAFVFPYNFTTIFQFDPESTNNVIVEQNI